MYSGINSPIDNWRIAKIRDISQGSVLLCSRSSIGEKDGENAVNESLNQNLMQTKIAVFKKKEIRRTIHANEGGFQLLMLLKPFYQAQTDRGTYWRELETAFQMKGIGRV